MAKILTTDNLEDIKKYTTKNQDMTLDVLLEPNNKEKLLNSNDSPKGGDATPGENKTLNGTDIWKDINKESTYQKFETKVSDTNKISSIPMYLKRENMVGVAGTNGGSGQKGYSGCQYAASKINYDPSLGQLTLYGIYNDFTEDIDPSQINGRFRVCDVRPWLRRYYPNTTFTNLPETINT